MMRDEAIPLTRIDSLSKEIECIMCLNIGNDSHMCIHSSAIVCLQCIESWLKKQNSCPKCSHSVQPADFVKCRLANKVVDFIEISKDKGSQHPNSPLSVPAATSERAACSEHISTSDQHNDDDYQQILTLNHKLLDFIRRRCNECREHLAAVESAFQMSDNDVKSSDAQPVVTEHSFAAYQRKKQVYEEAISTDQALLGDMERRLRESRTLSDQEDILQILQRSIPSKAQLRKS